MTLFFKKKRGYTRLIHVRERACCVTIWYIFWFNLWLTLYQTLWLNLHLLDHQNWTCLSFLFLLFSSKSYGKSDKQKSCVDATGLSAGDPVKIVPCVKGGTPGQSWTYTREQRFQSKLTSLCIDPMRFDSSTYPGVKRNSKQAVSLQECGASEHQKLVLTYVSITENAKAAEKRMHNAGVRGHWRTEVLKCTKL